jgi:hypothetical protein
MEIMAVMGILLLLYMEVTTMPTLSKHILMGMPRLGVIWDGMWIATEGPIDTTVKVNIPIVEIAIILAITTANDT